MDLSAIQENEPLSNHSTFRVGGFAKYFYEVSDTDELPELIKWAKSKDIPYFILGGGSNVLFKDSGFPGLVIKIVACGIQHKGSEVIAEAGAKIAQVARFAAEHDLGGLEEFVTLPGTVGGAVSGNAGCFWNEISDVLSRAWILKNGDVLEVENDYFDFKYRWSCLKDADDVLLKVAFEVAEGCDKDRMQDVLEIRKERQPVGMTAGCFFKNPGATPEMSAGYLIDKCGLKGEQVGGAQISTKHSNFILNTGDATANDILALADIAKKSVKGQFDIDLEPEIQVIG